MRLRAGASTDIGRVRTRNEDSYLAEDPLFVVADGMGGHRGGNVASALTVDTIREARPPWDPTGGALVDAVRRANRVVHERSASDSELRGMGTTVTLLQTSGGAGLIAHVGDSRAYLARGRELRQLTHDHTLVQQMVDEGKLSPEEAGRHPARNIITRSLGLDEDVDVDELSIELRPDDRVLLCTDGLTAMLEVEEIRQVLDAEPDAQGAADTLVALAVERGGEDNVTVIVVDVEEGETEADPVNAGTVAAVTAGTAGTATTVATRTRPADAKAMIERAEARAEASGPAPEPSAAPSPPRAFRWRRLAVWTASLAAVVAVALTGVRVYVDRQWYVGVEGGRVAVFNGIPAHPLGLTLSRVEIVSDVPAAAAERLQPWSGLAAGITADDRASAEAIVQQIRADVGAAGPASPGST